MRIREIAGVALVTVALAACGSDEESANYSGASSTVSETAGDASSEDAEPQSGGNEPAPPVVDPVSFKVLLGYLPAAPAGWTASEPQGSTTAVPGYKVSTVSNRYQADASEGAPAQTVSFEITDGGFAEMISAPFQMAAMMSHESTDGYQKGVTVAGQPGYETWQIESRQSDLQLLVGKRFLVHLNGSQVEPDALREWVSRVDLAKLAAEK